MDRIRHLADQASFSLALAVGMLDAPRPEWDAGSGQWVITARPRQAGGDWVLGRGPGPTGFDDPDAAWHTINEMRREAAPCLAGRR